MPEKQMPEEEIERRLKAHFESEAEHLNAPNDLWEKIEPRLKGRSRWWFPSALRRAFPSNPRKLIPVAATVAVLAVAVGGTWAVTAAPWKGNGNNDVSVRLTTSDAGGRSSAPGAPPVPTRAPAATPTPAPMWLSAGSDGAFSYSGEQNATGVMGPAGKAGPAGSPGLLGVGVPSAVPMPAPAARTPTPAPARVATTSESGTSALDTVQRQVISTASVSIEVQSVDSAVGQIQAMAQGMGGLVQQVSQSGGAKQRQATIVIRVPQDQFFPAMQRLAQMGKVESQNAGSQDVSDQFIDLQARLQSAQREEQSLLSLLSKTTSVSDVLTVERELTRVRSTIEQLQGQLNFLQRRIDLATINVSMHEPASLAPSASLTVEVSNVPASVDAVKALVSSASGVIDDISRTARNGQEVATISMRVPSAQFASTVDGIERQGTVKSKDTRQGTQGGTSTSTEPDARISLVLATAGAAQAPSASLTVEVSNVPASVNSVKTLISSAAGVIDDISRSTKDGKEMATIAMRVPSAQFSSTVDGIERQGTVKAKDTHEGGPGTPSTSKEPDARIGLVLVTAESKSFWTAGHIAAIAGPVGGVLVLALLALGIRAAYGAGRKQRATS